MEREIVNRFLIQGECVSAVPYGDGHINDTYAVTMDHAGSSRRYIFQRINSNVFRDVPRLMANIERVCTHAAGKLRDSGCPDPERRALTLVPGSAGGSFYQDGDGSYWRAYLFIERATGHSVIKTAGQAYEAAWAFGDFQKLLVDLPGERLNETILNFHNTRKRFSDFIKALDEDRMNRAVTCRKEIAWVQKHEALAGRLLELFEKGLIPERVTHNDTKLNNVLLDDDSGKAACVIDLDTVMPGLVLYDFGDLVRTSTSPVAEDEPDLSKVRLQENMFEALVKGYLDSSREFLVSEEVFNLPLSGMVITFETGLRFLADYLAGDVYFKIRHADHNLIRSRTQFALVDSMERNYEMMVDCVERHSNH